MSKRKDRRNVNFTSSNYKYVLLVFSINSITCIRSSNFSSNFIKSIKSRNIDMRLMKVDRFEEKAEKGEQNGSSVIQSHFIFKTISEFIELWQKH